MTKDKGCAIILIIGLISGMITGMIVGINVASWNYAGIIAQGYTEVIDSEAGEYFVRFKGKLYKLETVKDHDQMNDKISEILDKMNEHEEEDRKEFQKLHDKVK